MRLTSTSVPGFELVRMRPAGRVGSFNPLVPLGAGPSSEVRREVLEADAGLAGGASACSTNDGRAFGPLLECFALEAVLPRTAGPFIWGSFLVGEAVVGRGD
jgi:hypothetical protein